MWTPLSPVNLLISCLLASLALGQSNFRCPDEDGLYSDPKQCDKYYECDRGVLSEKLCPDGLVFDPTSTKQEPCDHYLNVKCGNRRELQPPQGTTKVCPRLNGFYPHPDPTVCNLFYSCLNGVSTEYSCSAGLVFDRFSGVCNWYDSEEHSGCQLGEAVDTSDGGQVVCNGQTGPNGDPHPRYAREDDCAKFYICLNGISLREQTCELGEVFDEVENRCNEPKFVPECVDYYDFLNEKPGSSSARKR